MVYRLGYDYTGGAYLCIYIYRFSVLKSLLCAVVEAAASAVAYMLLCYIFVFGALLGSSIRSESSGKLIGSVLRT